MIPPTTMNVLDKHGGFTALVPTGTLWRPSRLLRRGTEGTLVGYNEKSFYQRNNDVTMAEYKVPGYRYRVAMWFDNKTGERIA